MDFIIHILQVLTDVYDKWTPAFSWLLYECWVFWCILQFNKRYYTTERLNWTDKENEQLQSNIKNIQKVLWDLIIIILYNYKYLHVCGK